METKSKIKIWMFESELINWYNYEVSRGYNGSYEDYKNRERDIEITLVKGKPKDLS